MRIEPDEGLFSEIQLFWHISSQFLLMFEPEVEDLWINLTA